MYTCCTRNDRRAHITCPCHLHHSLKTIYATAVNPPTKSFEVRPSPITFSRFHHFNDIMHGNVESMLEETLPLLKKAKQLQLISHKEIGKIVQKRRNHEYAISRPHSTRRDFLQYAGFEKTISTLFKRRLKRQRTKMLKRSQKTTIDKKREHENKSKIHQAQIIIGQSEKRSCFIYSRAAHQFPGDTKLWIHYAKYCIENNMLKSAGRVFMKAIAYCGGHDETIWLSTMAFHFDICMDTRTARAVAQRGLRMLPKNSSLWMEYFRMELFYLSRLTARRFAMGLTPDEQIEQNKDNDDDDVNMEIEISDDEQNNLSEDIAPTDSEATKTSSDPVQKLAFWNGGVPLAVLKAACKKATLTDASLSQFYNLASQCPLVPVELLSQMISHLSEVFPKSSIVQFLSERVAWDCARVRLEREIAVKKSEANDPIDETELASMFSSQTDALLKMGSDTLTELLKKANNEDNSDYFNIAQNYCDAKQASIVKESLELSIDNLNDLMMDVDKSETLDQAIFEQLKDAFTQKNEINNVITSNSLGKVDLWDLKTLETYLEKGYDDFDITNTSLYQCVCRLCVKPFRNDEEDRIFCMYMDKNGIEDMAQMKDMFNFLMKTPPATMRSLTGFVQATLRLLEELNGTPDDVLKNCHNGIRIVLFKASGLELAKRDVSFWVLFVDFERRVAKNAIQTSSVNARAMRTLDVEYHDTLVERLSLINLR